jgi:hypothetical protein
MSRIRKILIFCVARFENIDDAAVHHFGIALSQHLSDQLKSNGSIPDLELIANLNQYYLCFSMQAATWVPDEAVDACMICRIEFSLFTRRHHCRRCGRCLCDSCSPVRAYGVGSKHQFRDQRVCPPCCAAIVVADKAHSTVAAPAVVVTSDQPSLIYQTYSSCAKCAIIDRKGFASDLSLPAEIIEQRGRVYLRCTCPVHGDHTTLYCSDAVFFKRMLGFMDEPIKSNRPPLPGMVLF